MPKGHIITTKWYIWVTKKKSFLTHKKRKFIIINIILCHSDVFFSASHFYHLLCKKNTQKFSTWYIKNKKFSINNKYISLKFILIGTNVFILYKSDFYKSISLNKMVQRRERKKKDQYLTFLYSYLILQVLLT